MDTLLSDLRYSARKLLRAPGFTLAAVLTLAIGIGANTAIFSVVNGVLLRRLPFPQPERLVRLFQGSPSTGSMHADISPKDFEDWRTQSVTIQQAGAYWFVDDQSGVTLTGIGDPERVATTFITGGFFPTLGRSALVGRAPAQEIDRGEDRVVALSYGYWKRRFGGDPSVIGRAVTLDRKTYTIAAVMPADFAYPSSRVEMWLPVAHIPEDGIPRHRGVRWLAGIGRLKDGVTPAQAQGDLDAIARRLAATYPESNAGWDATTVLSLREFLVGDVRPALVVLAFAVGLVLLIACANVANLQLARALGRGREIAVRQALGAAASRIIRQLLTESLLLSLIGGALGVALALWGVDVLLGSAGENLPRAAEVRTDGRVLVFAALASLVTGILFGLAPALRMARPNLQMSLKEGGRGSTTGGHSAMLRSLLVVGEIALAMVLVTGAGLMAKSLWRLVNVDPGFDPHGVLTVNFTIPNQRYSSDTAWLGYYEDVLRRVAAVRGVQAVGGIKNLPLRGSGEQMAVSTDGDVSFSGGEGQRAWMNFVGGDYFRAMHIPLKAGRLLEPTDRRGAPGVLVINEALAKALWPDKEAVGKTIHLGKAASLPVVGVVGDVHAEALGTPASPAMYISVFQAPRVMVNLVVRTAGPPLSYIGAVRAAIWAADPAQAITSIGTMESQVGESVARPRFFTALLVIFGAAGMILGALGVYGVISYVVSQRLHEIGIRVALGAAPREVLRMVVRQGLMLALGGVAIGLALALGSTRLLASLLYGVGTADVMTYGSVAVLLTAVACLASFIPARRAARVDPLVVLRSE
jgi:predicted permease